MPYSFLYIDPGTGSMLFSILIALATTAAFGARVAWMKARFIITRGKKEKTDARNRGIVIYSDDKRYWNVFGPICREAERRGADIVYMTQSADDKALEECKDFKHIKAEFIGEGNKGIAHINFLAADVVLSTTPNLDVYQWKRSREVKWYVHIPHAIPDMLTYRMFALDSYDAVLLTGDFQGDYIRRMERMRGTKGLGATPAHELRTVGYPPLDEQAKMLDALPPIDKDRARTVLFAPSWGESSMLSRHGEELICALIDTGYHIILRPHPQTVKTERAMLKQLVQKFPASDALEWNYDNDNFECLRRSDILVGDFSGIMFEYAVMLDRPVIYAKTSFDPSIYDAAWFAGEEIWRFRALRKIGREFNAGDIPHIKDVIDSTISDETLREGRQEVRDEAWTHRGNAAANIVGYLEMKQKELKAKSGNKKEEVMADEKQSSVYERLGKDLSLEERVLLKKADRENLYSEEPPFPKTNFLMELSNSCNHACIFCAHQKMKRATGKIDKAKAFDILRQAYELGTREVGFYSTGEPFLTNDLSDYIKEAKRLGYTYVYLTSNGALATPEKIRDVIDAGLDSIKFSINAPQRKLYAFIHGKDDFDTVMEHLRYLNQYRLESGRDYKIYVTGILTRFTENLKDKYYEVFGSLADQIVFKYVYNQGGYMPEVDDLLRCECDDEKRRRCNLPFDAISVTKEGYLSIENADYENMLIVADLNKVSLKDGWYGEKMKEMRRKFLADTLDGTLCDGCVHHKMKSAHALTPEYSNEAGDYDFNCDMVKRRIEESGLTVYVPMAADILHKGHINIVNTAARYGRVIVGLFTDDAIASYKRVPYMEYAQRKILVESIKGVSEVIPQVTKDYEANLRMLKPDFMVHGKDWRAGPLADVRQKAIDIMKEWGGQVIEPDYTQGVSSTGIQQSIVDRAVKQVTRQNSGGD